MNSISRYFLRVQLLQLVPKMRLFDSKLSILDSTVKWSAITKKVVSVRCVLAVAFLSSDHDGTQVKWLSSIRVAGYLHSESTRISITIGTIWSKMESSNALICCCYDYSCFQQMSSHSSRIDSWIQHAAHSMQKQQ